MLTLLRSSLLFHSPTCVCILGRFGDPRSFHSSPLCALRVEVKTPSCWSAPGASPCTASFASVSLPFPVMNLSIYNGQIVVGNRFKI